MKIKLLSILILIFTSSITFAQNQQTIIAINLNQNNLVEIQKLNLPVFHEFETNLITIVDDERISKLKKNAITFNSISEFSTDNTYSLVSKKRKSLQDITLDKKIVLFSEGNIDLVKNYSPTIDELNILDVVEVKLKPFTFKITTDTRETLLSSDLDELINDLIEDIDVDSVEYFIQSMQDFNTRYYAADNRREVAEWIAGEFRRFGITEVELDSFYYRNTWQYNVKATIIGKVSPEQIIIVGGHHDSITSQDPMNIAPGADDNASGSTAALEVARTLMLNNFEPDVTVQFVTFAAEELGLHGAYHHARQLTAEGAQVRLMINHDMISTSPFSVTNSSAHVNYYTTGEYFADVAIQNMKKYTPLRSFKGSKNPSFSDSYAYYAEGFPAIYFEENNFSPYYHTNDDLISNVNLEFCTEVIKASCATLISSMLQPMPVNLVSIEDEENGTAVRLEWTESTDGDFDYYRVSIGRLPNNLTEQYSGSTNEALITGLENGKTYYFAISVVDKDGYESEKTIKEFTPFNITLDNGLLVIDDTFNGNGSIDSPTDEEVDGFYKSILSNFDYTSLDLSSVDKVSIADIGQYSTILWHHDDLKSSTNFQNMREDIQRYMEAGGNFVYSGFMITSVIAGNNQYPNTFSENDFIYDYFKIKETDKKFGTRFNGAYSEMGVYRSIMVDSNKTSSSMKKHLRNVESINPNSSAFTNYFYSSGYDEGSVQAGMQGMSVGIEYMGDDYKLALLSFPLYYMDQVAAKEIVQTILEVKFSELTDVAIENELLPNKFILEQNYPNPFNPGTVINYQIPAKGEVSLSVYNLLGKKIITLVDEQQSAGSYKINFDGTGLSSGVYFYRLTSGLNLETKKMILLK